MLLSNDIVSNMAGTVVLGPDMGSQVLDHLSKMCDLSLFSEGYVAGQSVASAVFDLYGFGGGAVYNDIDIFTPERSGTLFLDQDNDAEYLAGMKSYRVTRVGQDGIINIVHCDHNTLSGERMIGDFDLNCVQVAVNLETREMIWTAAFLEFCLSRVIEVDNTYTPCHSLVRYFLKRDALPLAIGNDAMTIELLAMTILKWDSFKYPTLPAFGVEFLEQKYGKIKSKLLDFDLVQKPSEDGRRMFWLTPKPLILNESSMLDYVMCKSANDVRVAAKKAVRVHSSDEVFSF